MKLLKKLSAVAVVVILVIGASYFLFKTDNGKPKITNETIGVQVKELKELATIQYKYKEIASREDWNTLFNIKLPFTKSSFIVSYTGILKLGIDLSETKVDVDENSKTIKVTLPESKVLSNELDLKSLKVYDEKNSIFNPVKVKDYSEFTQSGKENAEKDARESGVFEQSKEVAKKIIIDLLNTTKEIKENYKIVFE
ncbi:DUF4230 domain-containing protein [Parvimonas micra]|uniref:DUF4230 domain-containing protein n=1 Tax=Parvimonas micra ATCC 33270 TaxID=411465 RepID=A8SJK3_9FIRM|nr:DUF4230 domain-containing protein [Parvimonas micra]EDP24481.1 hypothetical protein PEPMIC_00330 [Parvimonas micra ATCC 33270]RSB91345.1 DUF4230 domain-containing protein [Parvimonas micra]VEH95210.1 Uncharacterised protein [Parvimonas micra]